jgi:hypothetical protein
MSSFGTRDWDWGGWWWACIERGGIMGMDQGMFSCRNLMPLLCIPLGNNIRFPSNLRSSFQCEFSRQVFRAMT